MTFKKLHYTISNLHPKLVVKNYFSSTAAQEFKDFSSTFKNLPCVQSLSRALNFKNRIQAVSRIFQALCECCNYAPPCRSHTERQRGPTDLDRVQLVDSWSEVVRISSECDVE